MASGSSYSLKANNKNKSPVNATSFETNPQDDTISVNVDPSIFRAVVQKLTGSSTDPTVQNLPITISPNPFNENHNYVVSFNLPENRQTKRPRNELTESFFAPRKRRIDASPVSTLDTFFATGTTPRTPVLSPLREEITIANKSFYLHPRPFATSGKAEPKLLPLFPTSPDS